MDTKILLKLLEDQANPTKVPAMEAYMKNKFSFLGVQKPILKKIEREFFKPFIKHPMISATAPSTPPATGPIQRPANTVATVPNVIRYTPRSITRTRDSTSWIATSSARNTRVLTLHVCLFLRIKKTPP